MKNKNKSLGKPDIETESLRIWKKRKGEIPKKDKDAIEVDMGNETKISLCGYNKAYKKGTKKEVVFAWKFKHEDKLLCYYLPDEKNQEILDLITGLKDIGNKMGYEVKDIRDWFPSIKAEMEIMDEKGDGK